jgi:hypothetical protein
MSDTSPTPRDRNEERAIRIQAQRAAKTALWVQNIQPYPKKVS